MRRILTSFFAILANCYILQVQAALSKDLQYNITNSRLPRPLSGLHALYDGSDKIYLLGGHYNFSTGYNDQIWRYSLQTGVVEPAAGSFLGVSFGATAMYGEDIFHFGGLLEGSDPTTNIYKYSTRTGATTLVNQLPEWTHSAAAAWDAQEEVVYLVGGTVPAPDETLDWSDKIYAYKPGSNVLWQDGRLPLGEHRYAASAVMGHGLLYIFGGIGENEEYEVLQYDPLKRSASGLKMRLASRLLYGTAVFGGQAYIVSNNGLLAFNQATHQVEQVGLSGWPRDGRLIPGVALVPKEGRIYVFGGSNNRGVDTDEIGFIELDICGHEGVIRFPDLASCQSFYYCHSGVAVKYDCPGVQQFNPITLECGHADEVGCGNVYQRDKE